MIYPAFTGEGISVVDGDIHSLKRIVSTMRTEHPDASSAWLLGRASYSLSTAFFCGYQLAVHHLDADLKVGEFAAFCVSESGIRSPRDYRTIVNKTNGLCYLSGSKSHVMTLPLDYLYVLAQGPLGLVCVKVRGDSPGIQKLQPKQQPFVKDVPHCAIQFDQVVCEAGFYVEEAHSSCNKPFRYWEDVLVILAFAGWLYQKLTLCIGCDESAGYCSRIVDHAQGLGGVYEQARQGYTQASLDAFEALRLVLKAAADCCLSHEDQAMWHQDCALLDLGEGVRRIVRQRLEQAVIR